MLAVVAQLPAMVTVALITQYATMLWFAIGLAVATQVAANRARRLPHGRQSSQMLTDQLPDPHSPVHTLAPAR